ncbi:MAG: extracellular solute-binding protein [Anaerolineales bacterium]
MPRTLRFIVHFGLLLSTGCASIADFLSTPFALPPASPTPTSVTASPIGPSATSSPQTETPSNVTPTGTGSPSAGERVLRVWLPPEFDPNAATPASNILRQRLNDFEEEHPGLELEVRIKADEGESGLVNSLSVTSMAAPAVLPDLIALSRPALETAALKGLLHPLDGLSTTLDDSNWHEYARQLGRIQNTGYGLPFAGNALVLVYRSEVERINSWNDILASENPLVFAVGDPKALVGLALYVSAGGELLNAQGQPTLDQDVLTRVLTSISDGTLAGVFSPSLDNLVSNEQVLQAYLGDRANMAIIWASKYRAPEGQFTLPLPGLDDTSGSFATGWVWALAGSNPENQQLAVELADYLVADDFLGRWTSATGYLPTRPNSVVAAGDTITAIVESMQPIPSNEVLSVLGPLMQDALIRVLNGEKPEVVAENVIELLKQ